MVKAETLVAVHTHTHTHFMFTKQANCLKCYTLNKKCSFDKLLNIANFITKLIGQKPLLNIEKINKKKIADYLYLLPFE